MIEKRIAERFLRKNVGIVRLDSGQQVFSKGYLAEVTDTSIILRFCGKEQAIALSALENIREMD